MSFDYSKLKGRIRELYGTYDNIVPELSMSEATLSRRLNGKSYFDSEEILELSEVLGIEMSEIDQYFFKTDKEETSWNYIWKC